MRNTRRCCPGLERLESRVALSTGSAPLEGTLRGTFFAHGTTARSVDNLFTSGALVPLGRTLLVGGFPASGPSRGGNLVLEVESTGGHVALQLTTLLHTSTTRWSRQFVFAYRVVDGRGSGRVAITCVPAKTNVRGMPVTNPGFYGNATVVFDVG